MRSLLLWSLLFPLAASAAPITYDVHRVVYDPNQPSWPVFYVDGWLETDGTMGDWGTTHHVTDWYLDLNRTGEPVLGWGGWLDPEVSVVQYLAGITAYEDRLMFRPAGPTTGFGILSPEDDAWVLIGSCWPLCDENVGTDRWSAQIGRVHWGESYTFAEAQAPVPEPTSALLMVAGLLLLRRASRRSARCGISQARRPLRATSRNR